MISVKLLLLGVLSNLILLFIPIFSAVFGLIVSNFIRAGRVTSRRLILIAVLITLPCPVYEADFTGLKPIIIVLLETVLSPTALGFNIVSALAVMIVSLVIYFSVRYYLSYKDRNQGGSMP